MEIPNIGKGRPSGAALKRRVHAIRICSMSWYFYWVPETCSWDRQIWNLRPLLPSQFWRTGHFAPATRYRGPREFHSFRESQPLWIANSICDYITGNPVGWKGRSHGQGYSCRLRLSTSNVAEIRPRVQRCCAKTLESDSCPHLLCRRVFAWWEETIGWLRVPWSCYRLNARADEINQ